jgi:tetratricopeptide (TPR) repeat protein
VSQLPLPPVQFKTQSLIQSRIRDALAHHQAGRLNEAEQIYLQALLIEPENADCLHLLGMIAFQTGDNATAAELIRKAIAIHKTAASYYSNLGNVVQAEGRLDEAEACYRRALELKPDQAEVYLNLGHILKARGGVDGGLDCYRRALSLKPTLAEARVAESMALLLKGEFAAGWQDFESRWQTQDYDTQQRNYPQPLWHGEGLSGRLLIWGEQGVGDEIMFAGLVPDVIRAGQSCVLDCDPRLKPLFARSFPDVDVVSGYVPNRDSKIEIAAHLPSGSLPGLFRTSRQSFAATTSPYLISDPIKREKFRAKYHDGRLLVGLAWHTRNKKSGRVRSIDLSLFASLFSPSGIRWVSLQYGDHDDLQRQADATRAPLLIDREVGQLTDIDGFAAQVAAMDLVITIDNSTAHLAAALGVPTWLLLPLAPDWRWLVGGDVSPWYPTMRLFRQDRIEDWHSVLQRVESALITEFNTSAAEDHHHPRG